MKMSGREAVRLLAGAGVGERQARQVLAAGLAGVPQRVTGALLYDDALVGKLVRAPYVDEAETACPWGLFVARRHVDVGRPEDQRLASLASGWGLSTWTALRIRVLVAEHGHVPMVATVGGFVTTGAEIIGVQRAGPDEYHLTLQGPDGWFEVFRGRRFPTGPGRPWVLRGGRVGDLTTSSPAAPQESA
ncbi:MAG TPA: hypothetical protein VFT00_00210 [Nocardioides sp.]|nr:hypothetical protein [Nocardioides sp.]